MLRFQPETRRPFHSNNNPFSRFQAYQDKASQSHLNQRQIAVVKAKRTNDRCGRGNHSRRVTGSGELTCCERDVTTRRQFSFTYTRQVERPATSSRRVQGVWTSDDNIDDND